MQLRKTTWPRTVEEIYKSGPMRLPTGFNLEGQVILKDFCIVDMRVPQKGEYYFRSNGIVGRQTTDTKNIAMTRLILREYVK